MFPISWWLWYTNLGNHRGNPIERYTSSEWLWGPPYWETTRWITHPHWWDSSVMFHTIITPIANLNRPKILIWHKKILIDVYIYIYIYIYIPMIFPLNHPFFNPHKTPCLVRVRPGRELHYGSSQWVSNGRFTTGWAGDIWDIARI